MRRTAPSPGPSRRGRGQPGEGPVAAAAVYLSGGLGSPFVVYLSAPLVDAALAGHPTAAIAAATFGTGAYLLAVASASGVAMLGQAVDDAALLMLVAAVTIALRPEMPLPAARLSQEDRALLDELRRGLTYRQIAERHAISGETVKVRVARLYRHLGVATRGEAMQVTEGLRLTPPTADEQ